MINPRLENPLPPSHRPQWDSGWIVTVRVNKTGEYNYVFFLFYKNVAFLLIYFYRLHEPWARAKKQ